MERFLSMEERRRKYLYPKTKEELIVSNLNHIKNKNFQTKKYKKLPPIRAHQNIQEQ